MGSKTIMMGTPLRNTYALSVWCCWHVICLFCWNNDLELKPDERLEKVLLLNAKEHFYTVTGHHLCSFRICWMWRLRSMHKTILHWQLRLRWDKTSWNLTRKYDEKNLVLFSDTVCFVGLVGTYIYSIKIQKIQYPFSKKYFKYFKRSIFAVADH